MFRNPKALFWILPLSPFSFVKDFYLIKFHLSPLC